MQFSNNPDGITVPVEPNKMIRQAYVRNPIVKPGLYQEMVKAIDWDDPNMYNDDMTDEFISTFKEKINWTLLTERVTLTEDQLWKYGNYINWEIASKFQTLSDTLICAYNSLLDWDVISEYQELSERTMTDFVDKINWVIACREQELSIEFIKTLIACKPDRISWVNISSYQESIVNLAFANQYYEQIYWPGFTGQLTDKNMDIVALFKDKLVWSNITFKMGHENIGVYADYVDWYIVSYLEDLTDEFITTYEDRLNFNTMSHRTGYTETIINTYSGRWDWARLCNRNVPFSENFMHENREVLYWNLIAQLQTLSEAFIRQHLEYLYPYMNILLFCQLSLTPAFINEFKNGITIPSIAVTGVLNPEVENEYTITIINSTEYDYGFKYPDATVQYIPVFGEHADEDLTTISTGSRVILEPGQYLNVFVVHPTKNIIVGYGSFKAPTI